MRFDPSIATVLILIAFVLALLAAMRPQPFLPRVHPGWLAVALYFAAMLIR